MLRVLKFTTTEETALAGIKTGYLPYPSILTNKDWQKKKGLIGKMKKTGIGSALDKAEAVHKKIDWAYLAVNRENPANMEEPKKAIQEVKNYYASRSFPTNALTGGCGQQVEGATGGRQEDDRWRGLVGEEGDQAIVKEAKTQRKLRSRGRTKPDIKQGGREIERRQQLAVVRETTRPQFVVGAFSRRPDPTPESWDKYTSSRPGAASRTRSRNRGGQVTAPSGRFP